MKRMIPILGLLAMACGHETTAPAVVTPVQVTTVSTERDAAAVRYSATIRAAREVSLAFRIGGYVESVRVDAGDRVRRGQVLATVRQADFRDRVAQVRAQIAEAEAARSNAASEYERTRALNASSSATRSELEAMRARLDGADARLQQGRAALSESTLALGDATLVAPFDGIVLARNAEVGALAGPSIPAFVVADTRRVEAMFGVPDVMLSRLRTGDELEVAVSALGDAVLRGTITRIAPAADPATRVFDVELTIANPRDELKAGMIASLTLPGRTAAELTHAAMTVPFGAIVRGPNGGYAVYVVDGDVVHPRAVSLGATIGNAVVVTDGVRTGESIVASGASFLTDGQRVRIVGGQS